MHVQNYSPIYSSLEVHPTIVDVPSPSDLVGRSTGGTLPRTSPTNRIHRTEGSSTASSNSRTDLKNLISTWQDIVRRRESGQDIAAPIHQVQIGPMPMTTIVQPPQRERTTSSDSSICSAEESESPLSITRRRVRCRCRNPGPYRRVELLSICRNEQALICPTVDLLTTFRYERSCSATRCFGSTADLGCGTTWSGERARCSFLPPQHLIHQSSQIFTQPQAPLHDTLLEILRVSGIPRHIVYVNGHKCVRVNTIRNNGLYIVKASTNNKTLRDRCGVSANGS